jgi:hypothetical protein
VWRSIGSPGGGHRTGGAATAPATTLDRGHDLRGGVLLDWCVAPFGITRLLVGERALPPDTLGSLNAWSRSPQFDKRLLVVFGFGWLVPRMRRRPVDPLWHANLAGLSGGTELNLHLVLTALAQATRWGLISANPAVGASLPGPGTRRSPWWTLPWPIGS